MAATAQTLDVRSEALRSLREGRDLDELRQLIAREQLHSRRPDAHLDALLSLAVDVYGLSHAMPDEPIHMQSLVETYLPEYEFRGKVDDRNLRYALTYPALLAGGLKPDLARDLYYWRSELWPYVLHAITAYLRIAAERTGRTAGDLARDLPD